MARDMENYNLFNGSAAYDLYARPDYNGTAAPEIQSPGLPEERAMPVRKRHIKVKAAVSPTAVLGMMVVACMLIMVVFGYVQLYESTSRVSELQDQLAAVEEEQMLLQSVYEGKIDLRQIEQRAAELGLSLPDADQIIYVNLSGADHAEIYRNEDLGFFARIFRAIENSASGLVEYLS